MFILMQEPSLLNGNLRDSAGIPWMFNLFLLPFSVLPLEMNETVHLSSVSFMLWLLAVQLKPSHWYKMFEIKQHSDMKVKDFWSEQTRDRAAYLFNEPSKS